MAFPNASNTLYRLCWDSLSIAISVNSLEEKKRAISQSDTLSTIFFFYLHVAKLYHAG